MTHHKRSKAYVKRTIYLKEYSKDMRTSDVNLSKYDDRYNDHYYSILNGGDSKAQKQKLKKQDNRGQNQKSAKDKERAAQEKIKRMEAERARNKQLEITVPEEITVSELASRMKKTAAEVIKKLMFMGGEFGQFIEWNYKQPLDWVLLDYDAHKQLKNYVASLNAFYNNNAPFWEDDYTWEGFNWIVSDDSTNSVVGYLRRDKSGNEIISLCNFTNVTRQKYCIGVPKAGTYRVMFSSASPEFGGKGESTVGSVRAKKKPMHGYDYSIELDIEGLSCMFIKNTSRKKSI